ncbi:sphingomyelin phosphodiesterase [Musca domestica]|uniref:Sphingomyelin phosphodiesterase n=1 Tax=Musca domestica TaxID=7370 RepID=A0A1I8NAY0_MUSDO|nr:sphingomyelin phosphodiesterase [Musca domestica]
MKIVSSLILIFGLSFFGRVVVASNFIEVARNSNASDEELSTASEDLAQKYAEEYLRFVETGKESKDLIDLTAQLRETQGKECLFRNLPQQLDEAQEFFTCTTCRIAVHIIVWVLRTAVSNEQAAELAKKAFIYFCSSVQIQTAPVCEGLFNLNWPILYFILMNSNISPKTICGFLPIQFCRFEQPGFNWILNIDNSKWPLLAPKADVPRKTPFDLNILHLTDIHNDPEYMAGSWADCKEPMCCRASSTVAGKESNQSRAGYWGDYRNCDVPLYMVENALEHIRSENGRIDYIYYTGDIMPHNIWSTTRDGNLELISQIYGLLERRFPGIPVYPCVGNHEMHPVNTFGHENVPSEFHPFWLYEHLWSTWQRWLPADTKETIIKGGYYTVSPRPGFRIISLNNIDCYLLNWWIYYDGGNHTSIPQLNWLHDTLLKAEEAGEFVHILMHIPSGDSQCWTVWAREYNRVVERFSHTIGGIFNGHTHHDEFEVHYSSKGYPMAISWNGGSLTAYTMKNPNYRIYEVEPKTYQVVDHSTWIFNLTEANAYGDQRSPQWFREYQFSEFTENLSPAGIDALLDKMATNPEILRQYWKYKTLSSDPLLDMGCNNTCLLNTICNLATSVYNQKERCKELQAKLKTALSSE